MSIVNVGHLSRPKSEPVKGKCLRRLVENYWYRDPGTGAMFMIPIGFVWDGTSIPRLFHSVLGGPFNPMFEIAGLVHDYLYRKDVWDKLGRKEADRIFRDILILEDNPNFRAWEMYYGVRIGGYWSYNDKPLNWEG